MANKVAKSTSASTSSEYFAAGAIVLALLQGDGVSQQNAASWSQLYTEMSDYIAKDPKLQIALTAYHAGKDTKDIYDGTIKAVISANYMARRAYSEMNMNVARSYSAAGGGAVLAVFVDRFAAYAKSQGIELNQCALGISKVSLDVATAGGGAVTAVTGVGLVMMGIGIVSTFKDSYELGKACFSTP